MHLARAHVVIRYLLTNQNVSRELTHACLLRDTVMLNKLFEKDLHILL